MVVVRDPVVAAGDEFGEGRVMAVAKSFPKEVGGGKAVP